MLLILGICTLCLGTKALFILCYNLIQIPTDLDMQKDIQNVIAIFNMIVDIVLWTMIFSFVFEMNQVADVIKS